MPILSVEQEKMKASKKAANKGRHEAHCKLCPHPRRAEIEQEFVDWASSDAIAKKYSVSRDSIYRHAHALNLMEKRGRNIRAALEKIIERAGEVEVNANAVVSAIGAYARINERGEWIERREIVNVNALFDRMSQAELDSYARDKKLPEWFTSTINGSAREGGETNEQ
jgi:hypothetical protein